ncbi:hypothetical protein PQR53_35575 [Paraburkholderia fungorum]|uniref:hypothetical protein n=1 Tax=Paraburkholderia fungorum TaxID=134537 RepID=UPI0038BC112B
MLSDVTSDQHDYPQCEHCGAPLAGRFTPCPECNARPVGTLGVRHAPPSPLNVPLDDPQPMLPTRLITPRIWRPSSRDLINPYAVTEEPQVAVSVLQRLRQPVALSVSVLVVASAVYLGFLHNDDSVDGTPIAVSGKVTTQNVKPPMAVAQRPPPVAVTQRPSPLAVTQRPTPIAAAQRPPPVAVAQRPAPVVVAQRPARSPPIPPPAAPLPAARRVVTASAEAKHNPGGQPNPVPNKLSVDASKQIRSARANLQQNNLSATKARLAAAIAAQPDSPDAQAMRATVAQREQQRDALLSVARGCSYVGRWACVWLKAGDALLVDSSSKEAQSLVSLAMRESELASAWQPAPAAETTPDERSIAISHH